MKKHEWVKKNINDIRIYIKNGIVSPTILKQFDIYVKFKSYSYIKSKMQRYQNVAEDLKLSTPYVRASILEMKKNINIK